MPLIAAAMASFKQRRIFHVIKCRNRYCGSGSCADGEYALRDVALSLTGVPSTMVLPSSVAAVMVRVFPERTTGATVKNPRKVSPVANKRPSSLFLPSARVNLLSRASSGMVDVVTSRVSSVTKMTSDASMVTDIIFSASAKVCSTIIQPIWFASLNCRVFEFLPLVAVVQA